ncbi:MAG: c-type cytochrome [Candidatus Sericytochromatia bacterium]|nr:c-type cytochrome [Candidatus Sericytochromatia bacterium]
MRHILAASGLVASLAAAFALTVQPADAAGGNVANGKKVFQANCATCHGTEATKKPVLPNAANFWKGEFKRTKGIPANVAKIVEKGGAGYGGGASAQMPAWGFLKAEDRKDVVAYVLSFKKKK